MFNKRHQQKGNTSTGTPSPGSKNKIYLPASLRIEVRSPGFSSRLSALINEGNGSENKRPAVPLRPPLGAANFNPKYSGFGSRPKISLDKSPLPLLSPRNSTRVGGGSRYSPRSPVTMVKVAPSTPFTPFRAAQPRSPFSVTAPSSSVSSGSPITAALSETISAQGSKTDPRKVVMALQELSRSRKRGLARRYLKCSEEDEDYEDEEEETGSKRARRDSSSSVGSSLSMEMPPLFSNGVIGQTTSHLVSRETDLSLNSLLSRSQSIFGHASKSIGTHLQVQQSLNQQSMSTQGPASKKQKTINNAIQSSLSSSMNMKRGRDDDSDSDTSSSDDNQMEDLNLSKNHIVAPGPRKATEPKRQRVACSPSKVELTTTKKRVSFTPNERQEFHSTPKTPTSSASAKTAQPVSILSKKMIVPTMTEIIGGKKLSPKKLEDPVIGDEEPRKTVISSIEALDKDRENDRKRGENFMSIFETDEERAAKKSFSAPIRIMAIKPSFDIPRSSPTLVPISQNETKSKPDDAPATKEVPSEVEKTSGTIAAAVTETSALSALDAPKFPATTSTLGTTIASTTTVTETPATSTPVLAGFSFGTLPKPATTETSSTVAPTVSPTTTLVTSSAAESVIPKPTFSFGFGQPSSTTISSVSSTTTSAATLAVTTQPAAVSAITTTSSAPSFLTGFSFGTPSVEKLITSAPEVSKAAVPSPIFSFGSTAAVSTTATSLTATSTTAAKSDESKQQPSFSFGFGAPSDSSTKPFTFGSTAPSKTEVTTAPSITSSSLFSFGAPPTTSESKSQTSFSFGAPATENKDTAVSPFVFGDQSKPAEPAKSALTFAFGKPAGETAPSGSTFSFGKPAESTTTMGTTAITTASATPSLFQFGQSTATTSGLTSSSANPPSLFQFGSSSSSTTSSQASKTFGFGASNPAPPVGDVFKFGAPAASSTTGQSSDMFKFGGSASNVASAPVQSSFSFASALKSSANTQQMAASSPFQTTPATSMPKAMSLPQFGTAPAAEPSQNSGLFTFGSGAPAAPSQQSSSMFSFGSSQPAAQTVAPAATSGGVFQFGGPQQPAQNVSSTFGAPQQAAQNVSSTFGAPQQAAQSVSSTFGASQQPTQGVSSTFGAPQQAAQSVSSTFGAPAASSGGFNFGGAATSPSFSFGSNQMPSSGGFAFGGPSPAPSSFGSMVSPPQANPGQPSMFNIGSGTPKARTIAKARRTRR